MLLTIGCLHAHTAVVACSTVMTCQHMIDDVYAASQANHVTMPMLGLASDAKTPASLHLASTQDAGNTTLVVEHSMSNTLVMNPEHITNCQPALGLLYVTRHTECICAGTDQVSKQHLYWG